MRQELGLAGVLKLAPPSTTVPGLLSIREDQPHEPGVPVVDEYWKGFDDVIHRLNLRNRSFGRLYVRTGAHCLSAPPMKLTPTTR